MGSAAINPTSLPNPMSGLQSPFVDSNGDLTNSAWWFLHSLANSASVALSGTVATLSPAANGADNSLGITRTIAALIAVGGGSLQLTGGVFNVAGPIVFPPGVNNVALIGSGCTIQRTGNMPVGQGVFDLQGAQGVTISDLVIDGGVTVPVGIEYATFAYNPIYPAFLLNTSVWIHGGAADISLDGVTIQHTGGYAVFSDTTVEGAGNNSRISITRSNFHNNRPFLFGTNPADLNYGSWVGGIFYKGDCSTAANVGVTEDLSVTDCSFERNAGNCVWGHNAGFLNYHRNIRVVNNGFLDCGLDAILISCTVGGCMAENVGQRIGYVTTDDTSQSIPRYLSGLNATFLDFAGYVEGVSVTGNTGVSICGGFSAPDGFCYGAITGNSFRQPQIGDPLYNDDQIALIPAGVVYGFNFNNSNNTDGGDGIDCSGNALYGCTAGSIIGITFRNGKIIGNNIWQPGSSTFPPILLGNSGAQPNQRATSNSITGNRISWSPPVAEAVIVESTTWSGGSLPWTAGDTNWIEGNHVFDPTGLAFEFSRAASTSSTTRRRISSQTAALTGASFADLVRTSAANGTAGVTSIEGTAGTAVLTLTDAGVLGLIAAATPLLEFLVGAAVKGTVSADATFALKILSAAAANVLCILQNGNVGINQATPAYLLDINGTLHVVGAVTLDTVLGRTSGGLGFQPAGTGFLRDGSPVTDGELSGDITTAGSFVTALKALGPGAGTYTVGNRITPVTGNLGTITIDGNGRITAIQQAT